MIAIIDATFAFPENEPTLFWPAWRESTQLETNDVVLYMKNEFGGRFRGDDDEGWILSLAVEKFVS
jgi:hypothetical protein